MNQILCKCLVFFVAIFVSACTGSAYELPVVSEAERALVEEKLAEDKNSLKVYSRSDSHYKSRIAKIAERLEKSANPLCEQAEYISCSFKVTYSNEDIVNAYAHGDNEIVVHKGFLKYLQNNDEMAALVAHEMGHHLANHIKEQQQNAETGAAVAGLITAVLIGASNANNPYYNSYQQQQNQEALENMMQAGFEIGKISYSKEQEREADLLATYLLKHAGYNLIRAEGLMYKMTKIDADKVEGHAALASTHPPSTERVVAWQKAIDEIKNNNSLLPYKKNSK